MFSTFTTVADLIKFLQTCPQDALVVTSKNYQSDEFPISIENSYLEQNCYVDNKGHHLCEEFYNDQKEDEEINGRNQYDPPTSSYAKRCNVLHLRCFNREDLD